MSAVVTGAGRGIGRAIAVELAERGLPVAILARTRAEVDASVATVRGLGGTALGLVGDVAKSEDVERACRASLEAFGPPRVVVNNAGIAPRRSVLEMTEDDWDTVMAVNVKGAFLVTRAYLPSMLAEKRGRFVNIASISATLGTARQTAYNASKWAVVGFTKSLAEELRGTGLQTMSVLPGAVDTAMLVGSGFAPQMTAEQVARTVIFAALDAPDAMNGSSLEVFGP